MRTYLLAALVVCSAACVVPKSQYDAAIAENAKDKTESEAKRAALQKDMQAQIDDLKAKLADAQGKMAASSEATRAELEELRRQKAAAEERLKLFEDFLGKFKKMIEAGKLDITVRRGQIVLALGTDILFDTGKTEIKPEGKAALTEVAEALRTVTGRRFQVAGHTDNVPIKTAEFPSNWELSTARAVAVVKLLVANGVRSDAVSAAGYAQFDPAQSNASEKGRSKNRRIEIVIVPNVEDLVKMPEVGKAKEQAPEAPPEAAPPAAPPPPATPKAGEAPKPKR